MPQFLILKQEDDDWAKAQIVALVSAEGEPADVVRQGYVGDGRYAVLDFDERVECELAPGPIEVAAIEDRAAREEAQRVAGAALAESAEEGK